jgi:site-specific DNA-methyltransferase (adenine-specific)
MKVKMVAIEKLKPYPNNPRIANAAVEPVMASLRQFGARQPIVVDKEFVVVVGHVRLEAAKRLGWTEFPVHVAEDLTEDQAKAYRLADNKTARLIIDFLAELSVPFGTKIEFQDGAGLITF